MHVLLTEDQELFRRTVREFAEREIAPVAAEHDENETFPTANVKKMGKLGLMGLPVPTEYGGSRGWPGRVRAGDGGGLAGGRRAQRHHLGARTRWSASRSSSTAPTSRRETTCHRLASGDMIGSFCLSEPQSGSDARHMQTKAVRDGDYYVLNGTKNWISNGGEAGLCLVFARARRRGGPLDRVPGGVLALRDQVRSEGEEARDQSLGHHPGLPRGLPRAGRQHAGRGGRRLQDRDVLAGRRADRDRGAGARDRAGGVRRGRGVRQGARGVRPADRGVPGHPVDARRHAASGSSRPGC